MADQAKALSKEIAGLRRDAELLNNPDTFVQSAKLNRLANSKEKDLESIWNSLQENRKKQRIYGALKVCSYVLCWSDFDQSVGTPVCY